MAVEEYALLTGHFKTLENERHHLVKISKRVQAFIFLFADTREVHIGAGTVSQVSGVKHLMLDLKLMDAVVTLLSFHVVPVC